MLWEATSTTGKASLTPSSGSLKSAQLYQSLRTIRRLSEKGVLPALTRHDHEVMWRSLQIAQAASVVGVGPEQISFTQLILSSLLHDVGKHFLDPLVLAKPGLLTELERLHIRAHPLKGYELIAQQQQEEECFDAVVLDGILHHHERFDGAGYPVGLSGESIPLIARIISIADVFSALTHDRPYHCAWSKKDAFNYINQESGKQFDPWLVRQSVVLVDEPPTA